MSDSSPKKRKKSSITISLEIPTKKMRKVGKPAKDEGEKDGKAQDSEFHNVKASLVLSIPPMFSSNPRASVEEILDSMIMKYIPALQGVVLSHSNMQFLTKVATIKADCPFLVCTISFDATVWSPDIGMKLVGKVNLCSPDHVSLLLHRTFNVSIPRHHIPENEWEFEYGPAENDPEFGPNAQDGSIEAEANGETFKQQQASGGGKWIHHLTNEALGGTEGFLEFTVIGLTVANEMLSLLGSIRLDPFSPEYVSEVRSFRNRPQKESDIEEEGEGRVEHEEDIESDSDTLDKIVRVKVKETKRKKRTEDKTQGKKKKTV